MALGIASAHKPSGPASPSSDQGHGGRHLDVGIRKRSIHPSGFELDLGFAVSSGITVLFGPSGAGKTTLLNLIAGLERPDAGRIAVNGHMFFDSQQGIDLSPRHRNIGYVFQDLALFPHLSAWNNIEYGLRSLTVSERRKRVDAVLDAFRIAHLAKRRPSQISGGEQQRVALARALVRDPSVLLLDEPLSGLDAPTKSKILDDLREWDQLHRTPILYVTHSRDEVFALGEQVLVIDQGRVIAQGTPHQVMAAPRQETVAQLAGFENILDVTVAAVHEERGTMTCQINATSVALETPLVRASIDDKLRVGVRAGDILVAIVRPTGLSAQNIIPGRLVAVVQRDVLALATVDCDGAQFEVHLTLAARSSLDLHRGQDLWLVIKTYSCHLMAG